jgi:hypothetical protein
MWGPRNAYSLNALESLSQTGSEGGEFLDVPDNGFDDIAPIEQGLIEERNR